MKDKNISAPQAELCKCRLCAGALSRRFRLNVLLKYEVQYYECENCGSLQTETPYWLGEAYDRNLAMLDTGAAQRNIRNLAVCYAVSKLFGLKNAIDIGGGDGLLCRLLRDYGVNCFVHDKYAKASYAQGFSTPNFTKPDLVVAFEVLEHFANPSAELHELFELGSDVLVVSTGVYNGQSADWWYLASDAGQHVFFYSEEALRLIALKYHYRVIISGELILFAKDRKLTPIKSTIVRLLLRNTICCLIKSFVVLLPASGVWRDYHLVKKTQSDGTR